MQQPNHQYYGATGHQYIDQCIAKQSVLREEVSFRAHCLGAPTDRKPIDLVEDSAIQVVFRGDSYHWEAMSEVMDARVRDYRHPNYATGMTDVNISELRGTVYPKDAIAVRRFQGIVPTGLLPAGFAAGWNTWTVDLILCA